MRTTLLHSELSDSDAYAMKAEKKNNCMTAGLSAHDAECTSLTFPSKPAQTRSPRSLSRSAVTAQHEVALYRTKKPWIER
jgi:hypothetical protein